MTSAFLSWLLERDVFFFPALTDLMKYMGDYPTKLKGRAHSELVDGVFSDALQHVSILAVLIIPCVSSESIPVAPSC